MNGDNMNDDLSKKSVDQTQGNSEGELDLVSLSRNEQSNKTDKAEDPEITKIQETLRKNEEAIAKAYKQLGQFATKFSTLPSAHYQEMMDTINYFAGQEQYPAYTQIKEIVS